MVRPFRNRDFSRQTKHETNRDTVHMSKSSFSIWSVDGNLYSERSLYYTTQVNLGLLSENDDG